VQGWILNNYLIIITFSLIACTLLTWDILVSLSSVIARLIDCARRSSPAVYTQNYRDLQVKNKKRMTNQILYILNTAFSSNFSPVTSFPI
jgi:hypothetical protein